MPAAGKVPPKREISESMWERGRGEERGEGSQRRERGRVEEGESREGNRGGLPLQHPHSPWQ